MRRNVILLVEDNPDDEELAQLAFRKTDIPHELVIARDGQEALEYLMGTGPFDGSERPTFPNVLLLDLKIPKRDGLDVLRQLRSQPRTRNLPVVVLTSSREESDVSLSYQLGANSYVRKPVDFDEFVDTVRDLQQYWLLLNEPPPKPAD